jgi:carbamoyltransferase
MIMLICGIKISHDAGIAVINDGELLCSIEIEKLENRHRYSSLGDLGRVAQILKSEGLDPEDIDQFVVDGWFVQGVDDTEVTDPAVLAARGGGRLPIPVAPYQDRQGGSPLARYSFADHSFSASADGYASYHHVSNHLLGGYCSSPFAARGEDALVLVWDGGTVPRLYAVTAAAGTVRPLTDLLPITGDMFGEFSSHLDPFFRDTEGFTPDQIMRHHLSVAGKAMAYAALGRAEEEAYPVFDDVLAEFPYFSAESSKAASVKLIGMLGRRGELLPGLSDADLIATFQEYLGNRLLDSLTSCLRDLGLPAPPNLVMAGGCALNIKWNSRLRHSGLVSDIWVPPFPNDSGAAIGTAACEMFRRGRRQALDWNVYSGPQLTVGDIPPGWRVLGCGERELAGLLHATGEPVVVLSGRAEIGPRALGNRSILAPATDPAMKDRLNAIKDRAHYRPVAPICLASRAAEVFTPGNADPYMLFEHRPRPGWAARIPAVLHLDGTARLQTIDASSSSPAGRILEFYSAISGIPVLCNTSANFGGCGFFPDVASAIQWGQTNYVWSDDRLYIAPGVAEPELGG